MAADAVRKVLELFNIANLKYEQKKMLDLLLKREDGIAVLPTGYGKSLPYQMLVPLRREMGTDDKNCKVIVCSPLVAIMRDQCERLNSIPSVRAVYKGIEDDQIDMGKFDYLFASPEYLVGDKKFRATLRTFDVSTIVVDELDTITTRGEEEGKQAFKKWFSHIGELRSIFPKASVLALSATCTKKISKRVSKILQLPFDKTEIRVSPDKENIKIVIRKIPNSVEMAMVWLVDALLEKTLPGTILDCTSIKDASNIYSYIIAELPLCNELQMFHSEMPDEIKARILSELVDEKSTIKLVIATSALGMGVDIRKYSSVILYSPPKNIVDVVQEIGRVGRDGTEALALIVYNSYHLRTVDTEVKEIFKTTVCRRLVMLTPFLTESELEQEKKKTRTHTCCDLCADRCDCGSCDLFQVEILLNVYTVDILEFSDHSSSDTESYSYDEFDDNLDIQLSD